jgi:hypothetical protein
MYVDMKSNPSETQDKKVMKNICISGFNLAFK